ncbi:uncharacterized protein N7482_005860 [Penicillium canariense]|uniref:Uncharacterized protein n=1 Tax=Penicillium canariense TaxID=189055 RepID=A0A9W9LMN5_9EURO|nr:uncharacterized protein N7482_005860 [Penicillium canariense]KAJ5167079.1 hypothetical protein N7482_005860 [Penicillium canariense]
MPGIRLVSPKLSAALVSRASRTSIFPTQPITQPAAINIPGGTRNKSISKPWEGSQPEEHTIKRAKEGEAEDPATAGASSGMKEREVNEGVADSTKSQGMTERGGRKHSKKAKKEHPAAPEPIIGMNDERAEKGH